MFNLILLPIFQSTKGSLVKLKLEIDGDITFLVVSEAVDMKQLPVLKAGLKKLFQSNKKTIVLDFLAVPETCFQQDTAMTSEISQLPKWAQELGAQLLVASGADGVHGYASRQGALEYLQVEINRLLATENQLTHELAEAEQLKAEIRKKLDTNAAEIAKLKNLKKDHSRLKKEITQLEEAIQRQLARRIPPVETLMSIKQKNTTVRNLLITVLEQEGAIPAQT